MSIGSGRQAQYPADLKSKTMTRTLLILIFASSTFLAKAQLQSGPMLGYAEMREVLLWVQTTQPAVVQFVYWDQEEPNVRYRTEEVQTLEHTAFTARCLANQVEPGKEYAYELLINGEKISLDYPTTFATPELWQWRTDPPSFTMALGSCYYANEPVYDRPGTPYGGDYQIFTSIYEKQPDVMLWLGDNVYLREADWYSRTGIMHRYTHTRSLPELQPLLASTHHYAIWDDHDFGPNNSDRSFIHKDVTLEAFDLFWGNPTTGLPGHKGITTFFQWADIDFFLLDDRYFRTPNNRKTGERTLLGEAQLEWIIDALVSSNAPFKMVAIGGQVLNTAQRFETYNNLFPEERQYLLRRIEEEGVKNVVFLTGDRHHTELSRYENRNGHLIYDWTVSPLTSGAASRVTETNLLRVDGTLVTQRNFGMLQVSGPRNQRTLTLTVYDSEGEELWTRTIEQQD